MIKRIKKSRALALQAHRRVSRTVLFATSKISTSGNIDEKEVRIARKNHLGLEFLSHFPQAAALLQEEREKQNAFQQALHESSAMLAAESIPHIFIKFRKQYLYYDSNVDIIVHQSKWNQTRAVLEKKGYTGHVMFKEPDKIMFSKIDSPVSIHLHPGVTWNGVPYFSSQELWKNSNPMDEYAAREMSPQYDFLINLAHDLFENYEISLGDVLYFKRMLQNNSFDHRQLERIAEQNGWRNGFKHIYGQVIELVETWEVAEQSEHIPEKLLTYPYQISLRVLASAYSERIASNIAGRRFGPALREILAYPSFYALKRRHDLHFFYWQKEMV